MSPEALPPCKVTGGDMEGNLTLPSRRKWSPGKADMCSPPPLLYGAAPCIYGVRTDAKSVGS